MKYTQSRSHKNKSGKKGFSWWFVIAGLILAVGLLAFVRVIVQEDSPEDGTLVLIPALVDDVETEDVLDMVLENSFEQVDLIDPDGRGYTGVARRGIENDLYTHVVVADLPAIDQEYYFYEGWLVQPGVLQFFSTGEMFEREDGKWGLVWEVQERDQEVEVVDFTRAVITLEPRDGDPAPAADHVLEGDFEIDVEFSGLLPF